MTSPKDEPESAVLDERSPVRVGLVLGTGAALVAAIWWAAQLTADVNTIKQQISKFSSIDTLSQQIVTLTSRIDALERRGSEPMQHLQQQMDKIANDLEKHILITEKARQP